MVHGRFQSPSPHERCTRLSELFGKFYDEKVFTGKGVSLFEGQRRGSGKLSSFGVATAPFG